MTQPNQKPYTGDFPQCNVCKYHHPTTSTCRQCFNCGHFGHFANACRWETRAQVQQPNAPANTRPNNPVLPQNPFSFMPYGRVCFQCGDPTHFRSACPQLTIVNNAQANQAKPAHQVNPTNPVNPVNQVARGRAFNLTVNPAQTKNEVVNGTFLVNNRYASILFDTGVLLRSKWLTASPSHFIRLFVIAP
jgi:hypothetical protein